MLRLKRVLKYFLGIPPGSEAGLETAVSLCLRWFKDQSLPTGGIRNFAGHGKAYPEVTGYFIPTLLEFGEGELAVRWAWWLASMQNPDGSWSGDTGQHPYTFDTGQVLRGLLAAWARCPELESAIRRGCNWMLTRMEETGQVTTPDRTAWKLPGGRMVSEAIHLYALEPMREAGRVFGDSRYTAFADRTLNYYRKQYDLSAFDQLSHFHAYVLEALVDLGCRDLAEAGMDRVEKLQRPDGSVPAYPGVDWVCTTGVAQYAVIWYKLGRRAAGDRAMDCLMRRQNRSGGFFGSYGRGAEYFPDKEISWAVKFFLDASWWRVRSAFEAEAAKDYPEHLSPDDGRLAGLVHELAGTRRILDAGCGKGRYLKALQARDSGLELWGVDVSVEMLHHISPEIRTRRAELVNLPFPDSHFDAVYCIEALEHALLPEQSIRELCRVVRPGGKVILIDKNERFRGAMRRAPWEQWFDRETVEAWLGNWCGEVGSRFIGYDGHPDPTGLFILWRGIRR